MLITTLLQGLYERGRSILLYVISFCLVQEYSLSMHFCLEWWWRGDFSSFLIILRFEIVWEWIRTFEKSPPPLSLWCKASWFVRSKLQFINKVIKVVLWIYFSWVDISLDALFRDYGHGSMLSFTVLLRVWYSYCKAILFFSLKAVRLCSFLNNVHESNAPAESSINI